MGAKIGKNCEIFCRQSGLNDFLGRKLGEWEKLKELSKSQELK